METRRDDGRRGDAAAWTETQHLLQSGEKVGGHAVKRKPISLILLVLFIGIGAFAGWKIYEQQSEYQSGENAYEDLEQYVFIPDPVPSDTEGLNLPSECEDEERNEADDTVWPEIDFEALQVINPDIVAWLYLEGTEINYPDVQGADNE